MYLSIIIYSYDYTLITHYDGFIWSKYTKKDHKYA